MPSPGQLARPRLAVTGILPSFALEEIFLNIISYGYEDTRRHQVEIQIALREDVLQVTVRDDGKPFNPSNVPEPELNIPLEDRELGGLGVHLARNVVDSFAYRREGQHNILTISKRLRASSPKE